MKLKNKVKPEVNQVKNEVLLYLHYDTWCIVYALNLFLNTNTTFKK